MTDQHRATPEQWAALEEQSAPEYDNTILELRARVEALEASARIGQLAAPANTEARPGGLAERVALRIAHKGCFAPEESYGQEARAAIREVAAWLSEHTDDDAAAYWAARLEQEADR